MFAVKACSESYNCWSSGRIICILLIKVFSLTHIFLCILTFIKYCCVIAIKNTCTKFTLILIFTSWFQLSTSFFVYILLLINNAFVWFKMIVNFNSKPMFSLKISMILALSFEYKSISFKYTIIFLLTIVDTAWRT